MSVAACTPDAPQPVAPGVIDEPARIAADRRADDLRNQYDWLGKYHTDGLIFVYDRLAETKGRLKNRRDLCKAAAKAVKEFHRIARKSDVPLNLVDPSLALEVCAAEKAVSPDGIAMSRDPGVRANLSPAAVSHIDQVYTAINSATSRSALLNALRSIEYSAITSLPNLEAGAVVGVVSIAMSSVDYWEANLDNWVTLPGLSTPYSRDVVLKPGAPLAAGMPRWWNIPFIQGYRRVLIADALGGARVLYTTWMAGPVGWDAAAAAALWSSTSMALSLLF
jgi:hypothetical protein